MKPLLLEFEGFRSYRSRVKIDFTDLGLFAVVGDTGAGKSTINEAITYALYGRATFQDQKSSEGLTAEGRDSMLVSLTFLADGHTWVVTRAFQRRSKNKIAKLECPELGLKYDGARELEEAIARILGLNAAQFTKAVVLPQGRFDEFLQAKPKERLELLSPLLGLDRLGKAREEIQRGPLARYEPILSRCIGVLKALPADPAADLAELARRSGEVDDAIEATSETAGQAQELRSQLDSARALSRSVLALEAEWVTQQDSTPIDGYEVAGLDVRSRYVLQSEFLETAARDVEELQARRRAVLGDFADRGELSSAVESVVEAEATSRHNIAELNRAEEELKRIKSSPPKDERSDGLVKAAEASSQQLRLARENLSDLQKWILSAEALEKRFAVASGQRQAISAELARLDAEMAAAKPKLSRLKTEALEAETALLGARSALDATRQQNAVAVAAKHCEPGDPCPVCEQKLPESFVVGEVAALDSLREAEAEAQNREASVRRGIATLDAELAALERDRVLKLGAIEKLDLDLSAMLDEARSLGKAELEMPSPGAHQVQLFDGDRVKALLSELEESASTAAAVHHRATVDLETSQVAAKERQRAHDAEVARVSGNLGRLLEERQAALETLGRRLGHGVFTASAGVFTASAGDLTASAGDLTASAGDLTASAGGLTASAGGLTASAGDLGKEIDQWLVDHRSRLAQLESIDHDLSARRVAHASAETSLPGLRLEFEGTFLAPMSRVLISLDRIEATAKGIRDGSSSSGAEANTPRPGTSVAEELISAFDVTDEDPVGSVLDVYQRRLGAVATLMGEMTSLRAATDQRAQMLLAELDSLGERTRPFAALVGLDDDRPPDPQALLVALGLARRGLATEIVRAEQSLERWTKTRALLDRLSPLCENLTVLKDALSPAKSFVSYLVTQRQSQLRDEASRRLIDISDGVFSFADDFEIVFRPTGERRSAAMLSGGERFQAALSLALGLVEIVSRNSGRLEAVFVDEGFGSLDSASLDAALATLARVSGGGKMVGLISHVRRVAESVDDVLYVEKDDVFGSRISRLNPEELEQMLVDDVRSGLNE